MKILLHSHHSSGTHSCNSESTRVGIDVVITRFTIGTWIAGTFVNVYKYIEHKNVKAVINDRTL